MAGRTLDAMADGGMFDHLGGGFARYSVDENGASPTSRRCSTTTPSWPTCYLEAYQATGGSRYPDHRPGDPGLPAAGPARSRRRVPLQPRTRTAKARKGVSTSSPRPAPGGPGGAAGPAVRPGLRGHPPGQLRAWRQRAAPVRGAARTWTGPGWTRPGPGCGPTGTPGCVQARTTKCWPPGTAWPSPPSSRGFQVLGEPRYLEAATGLARFLDGEMAAGRRPGRAPGAGGGPIPRASWRTTPPWPEAWWTCTRPVSIPAWLRWAGDLAETMRARFEDPAQGGFFRQPRTAATSCCSARSPCIDGALPSGNTLAARALLRLAGHLERPEFRASAEGVLRCAGPAHGTGPGRLPGHAPGPGPGPVRPVTVVIAGAPADPAPGPCWRRPGGPYLPGLPLSLAAADPALPLHRDRRGGARPAPPRTSAGARSAPRPAGPDPPAGNCCGELWIINKYYY